MVAMVVMIMCATKPFLSKADPLVGYQNAPALPFFSFVIVLFFFYLKL